MVRLGELARFEAIGFDREDSLGDLAERVGRADAVVHLAGINRPKDVKEFAEGNVDLTVRLCELIATTGRKIPLIISSSIQAELTNPYGESKRGAELAGEALAIILFQPVKLFMDFADAKQDGTGETRIQYQELRYIHRLRITGVKPAKAMQR